MASAADIANAADAVQKIHVAPAIQHYIVEVADETRSHPDLTLGASPRGALALQRAARALAMMFVLSGHAMVSFTVTPVGWAIQDRAQFLGVDLYAWVVRAFAMPTFFWLAGYFGRALLDGAGFAAESVPAPLPWSISSPNTSESDSLIAPDW